MSKPSGEAGYDRLTVAGVPAVTRNIQAENDVQVRMLVHSLGQVNQDSLPTMQGKAGDQDAAVRAVDNLAKCVFGVAQAWQKTWAAYDGLNRIFERLPSNSLVGKSSQ